MSKPIPLDPVSLEKQLLAAARRAKKNPTTSSSSASVDDDPFAFKDDAAGTDDLKTAATDSAIVPLSENGRTIAMSDVEGRVALPTEWYEPIRFVCHHCLLPAENFCFGFPVGSSIDPRTKKTIWIVRGKFGSVGCALRYANDNRYTFAMQTVDLVPNMLKRVYGVKTDIRKIPRCPARTMLPPFVCPAVPKPVFGPVPPPITSADRKQPITSADRKQPLPTDSKSADDRKQMDDDDDDDDDDRHEQNVLETMRAATASGECAGLALHRLLSMDIKPPDRSLHQIEHEPSTVLIDSHVATDRLGFGVRRLAEIFPGFCIRKPRVADGNASSFESMPYADN